MKITKYGKKHVHHDVIVAWAKGAEVQVKQSNGNWCDTPVPSFDVRREYRVKQEELQVGDRVLVRDDQNVDYVGIVASINGVDLIAIDSKEVLLKISEQTGRLSEVDGLGTRTYTLGPKIPKEMLEW